MKITSISLISFCLLCAAGPVPAVDFHSWAPTPPMGWNSWDCFGTTVTEAQTKAQSDFMAAKLKAHGWQYIVVDIQWYQPKAKGHDYEKGAILAMDEFSRLIPAPEKFPSAAGDHGFKSLADYVHAKGLKFGIHMMRGIPRQAVQRNTPIKGTIARAADIADPKGTCPWNSDMFGVDTRDVSMGTSAGGIVTVSINLAETGVGGSAEIRDLWAKMDLGRFNTKFSPEVQPHGARLFRLSPVD